MVTWPMQHPVRSPWGKGSFIPLLHVKAQCTQWGYINLHPPNGQWKSKKPHFKLSRLGKGKDSACACTTHPVPLLRLICSISALPHYTPPCSYPCAAWRELTCSARRSIRNHRQPDRVGLPTSTASSSGVVEHCTVLLWHPRLLQQSLDWC